MVGIQNGLGFVLRQLVVTAREKLLDGPIDLLLAQEDQVSSARVWVVLRSILVDFLRLLVYFGFDPRGLEQLLNSRNSVGLLDALFLKQASNLFRQTLRAVPNLLAIKLVLEVAADRPLPRLGGNTLAWDTTEDRSLRRTGVIAVDQGRRDGLECVDINDEGYGVLPF